MERKAGGDSEPIRLLLSGGGHRATVGSLGAVAYLVHSDRWSSVTEVVSVSGGSIANAALASAPGHKDAWAVLSDSIARINRDQGRVWATPRRTLLAVSYLVAFAAVFTALAIAVGFGPDVPPLVSVLTGVLVLPVCFRLGGMAASMLTEDFIHVVSGDGDRELLDDWGLERVHMFCSSGLSSATPYLLWTGRRSPEGMDPTWGAQLQAPYTVVEAALASVSLPFLGRVRSPKTSENPDVLAGGEILVDGGVSGIFGEQVATPFRRTPADTDRSDDLQIVAIDAGRHVTSPGKVTRVLERYSVSATLLRWLKASLEATYVNDLIDLGPDALVRICEPDDLIEPDDSAPHMATSLSGPLALRLGSMPSETTDPEVQKRILELRERVAGISLMNLNEQRIAEATVAGFVGTMMSLDPTSAESEVVAALLSAEEHLGLDDRLSSIWVGLG